MQLTVVLVLMAEDLVRVVSLVVPLALLLVDSAVDLVEDLEEV